MFDFDGFRLVLCMGEGGRNTAVRETIVYGFKILTLDTDDIGRDKMSCFESLSHIVAMSKWW